MKGEKILITGGSGFIGKHLVRRLCEDNKIYAGSNSKSVGIRHKNVYGVKIDLLKQVKIPDVDYVFHLAACTKLREMQWNPGEMFKVNVLGTINLLESLKGKKIKKFIFMSSSAVYGNYDARVKEEGILNPVSFYGLTKLLGEKVVEYYKMVYGMNVEIARGFNIYGEGMDDKSIIAVAIKSMLEKKDFKVNDEDAVRDFLHVDDAIEGLIKIAENGKSTIYNLGTGVETRMGELVKIIHAMR